MMKTGILGASGRMGRMIAEEIAGGAFPCVLHAAADRAPGDGVTTISADEVFESCDVIIDFTAPDALEKHGALAARHKKPWVCGVTGLAPAHMAALEQAASAAPVLYAANMSLGVNLLAALVEQAAARLDAGYDIEIFDAHHRHKADAPSGTALMLAAGAAAARGVRLEDALIPARAGQIGPRPRGAIGICVFRGGDVAGDHTVTFAGDGERVELTHKASDRAVFARGAVKAALWLRGKPPGLYTMRDVLGV